MEDRIQKAVELFKSGYNCSQSVVAAFADMYGFTQEQALRMSASFGGGIGRMRETCGAACGMFLVAGLETGATEATDREGKAANYAVVQELAAEFKKRNGSLICGELLGLKKKEPVSTIPEERTAQYYSKRPCKFSIQTSHYSIISPFLKDSSANHLHSLGIFNNSANFGLCTDMPDGAG